MVTEGKFVLLSLGTECYGVPILYVETILNNQKPVRIPKTPKMFMGVFELRGKTLPAVDLRTRLELPENSESGKYVVVTTPYGQVALKVDEVVGISELDSDSYSAPNSLVSTKSDEFLAGVGRVNDKMVALIDLDHIIPEKLAKSIKVAA